MDVIFDTASGELTIDVSGLQPWGADIRAMINRHGSTVNLRGVEMHISIEADGIQIFQAHLPPSSIKYKQTDQDLLATGRCRWLPDQSINVVAWCKTNSGHEVTADASYTSPRPAQPFPSWIWSDGRWIAPVSYPDDAGDHVWSESDGAWVIEAQEE